MATKHGIYSSRTKLVQFILFRLSYGNNSSSSDYISSSFIHNILLFSLLCCCLPFHYFSCSYSKIFLAWINAAKCLGGVFKDDLNVFPLVEMPNMLKIIYALKIEFFSLLYGVIRSSDNFSLYCQYMVTCYGAKALVDKLYLNYFFDLSWKTYRHIL